VLRMIAMVPTYINTYLVLVSRTVLSCGSNVMISSCVCDEKGAAVKRLGAGALDGRSAAGPAIVAGRTSDAILDSLSL
jgi:hypothetical protein